MCPCVFSPALKTCYALKSCSYKHLLQPPKLAALVAFIWLVLVISPFVNGFDVGYQFSTIQLQYIEMNITLGVSPALIYTQLAAWNTQLKLVHSNSSVLKQIHLKCKCPAKNEATCTAFVFLFNLYKVFARMYLQQYY